MNEDTNSGNRNSGDYNSGNSNSGDYNSGNSNSGDFNSGYCNSGDYNSGNSNSGDYNSGDFNSGDFNSGHFNTTEPPKTWMFDQWVDLPVSEIQIPLIVLPLTEWVDGELVARNYSEAWEIAWSKMDVEKRQQFLDLPGFDSDVFEEITGIAVGVKVGVESCDGEVVEIRGKRYRLIEEEG